MATDIILYDQTGQPVTYPGVDSLTTDTPEEGVTAKFTHGTLLEGLEIEPDFSSGAQTVTVPDGYLVREAAILKPEALVSGNIAEGVEIAGIKGSLKDLGADVINNSLSGMYYSPNVTMVPSYKFYYASNGSFGVSFPKCTTIGNSAFYCASALNAAYFDSVETIGSNAFFQCYSLAEISFPNCTTIGSGAFDWCSRLTEAVFPACTSITGSAFKSCYSMSRAEFPLLEYIPSYCFNECSSLASISFSAAIAVYQNAFAGCLWLSEAIFPVCRTLDSGAFANCWNALTTISFPVCKTVGSNAFAKASLIKEAVFPSCTTVGSSAFYSCTSLTVASFPLCTSIASSAFRSCKNLATAYFPLLSSVSHYTFHGCVYGMKSVNFNAVTTIGSYGFWNINGWNSLTPETFPELVTVGSYAFQANYYLSNVFLPKAATFYVYAFASCTRLETLSLPACKTIYGAAFMSCTSLMSVYLLGSGYAFLSYSTAFSNTPLSVSTLTGEFGSFFVRESMLATYRTSGSWSYFADRFVGLTDEEIAALERSTT